MKYPNLLFLLLVFGCFACQQDHQHITLKLDQRITNSYHQDGNIKLSPDETVIYDNGVWKVSTRAADVQYRQTRFRIGLIDSNQDGRYNEPNNDIVLLSIYGQPAIPIHLTESHVGVQRSKTIIQVDRHFFLLDDETGNGKTLNLVPWERVPPEAITASLRTRMNNLPVRTVAGVDESLDLSHGPVDKEQILLVWNYADGGEVLAQQLGQKTHERFHVTPLNMLDQPEQLRTFLQENASSLDHYLVSSLTCEVINCHARTPYGIRLDAYGNIVNIHLSFGELKTLLRQAES
ncbi:MAG: hypothetical protein AAGJ82_00840 [Bacteroidota bacterium]